MHLQPIPISDQTGDPSLPDFSYTAPAWTEGSFEFQVVALINSTNGLGSTVTKLFPVNPADVFDVIYDHSGFFYTFSSITAKDVNLSIPIAGWDLRTTAAAWKIIVSEVDPSEVTTSTFTQTTQFATNFGLDFSKIGLKFGATATTTNTQTYTLVTNLSSDPLGEAALYFYDPILLSWTPSPFGGASIGNATIYDIDTGWMTMSIYPDNVY